MHFTRQTFVWFRYRFWTKKTRSSPPAHAPGEVGELADGEEVVGLEQREAVLEVEPLAGLDLVAHSSSVLSTAIAITRLCLPRRR